MEIGIIILLIVAFITMIWVIFGIKQMKQKILTFLLVILILFIFLSFIIVFKGKDISIKSISDIVDISKIYFSWLLGIFDNLKIITTNAIKMNWVGNSTT